MMLKHLAAVGGIVLLTACASDLAIEHEYQEANSQPRMPLQDDGEQRPYQDLYPVPEAQDIYSDHVLYRLPLPTPALTQQREKITFNRLAEDSWLTVQITPSQLWPQLKRFISEQKDLRAGNESGRVGLMNVYQGDTHYRFKISQGFQPKSSELTIVYVVDPTSQTDQEALPESGINKKLADNAPEGKAEDVIENTENVTQKSSDQAEQKPLSKSDQMLQQVAAFLSKTVDQPAYSYAAQGISTAKKLWLSSDENGIKQLFLVVSKMRAMGSLRLGLEGADFKILNSNPETGLVEARYLPPLPEDEQPGFIKILFGVERKAFDEDVEYGGDIYQFTMLTLEAGKQRVSIDRKAARWPSQRLRAAELNAIMRLLEHSIQ